MSWQTPATCVCCGETGVLVCTAVCFDISSGLAKQWGGLSAAHLFSDKLPPRLQRWVWGWWMGTQRPDETIFANIKSILPLCRSCLAAGHRQWVMHPVLIWMLHQGGTEQMFILHVPCCLSWCGCVLLLPVFPPLFNLAVSLTSNYILSCPDPLSSPESPTDLNIHYQFQLHHVWAVHPCCTLPFLTAPRLHTHFPILSVIDLSFPTCCPTWLLHTHRAIFLFTLLSLLCLI